MSDNFLRDSGTLNDLLGYLDSVQSKSVNDFVLPDLSQAQEVHSEIVNKMDELESTIEASRKKEKEAKEELAQVKEQSAKEIEKIKAKSKKKIAQAAQKYTDIIKQQQEREEALIKQKEQLLLQIQQEKKRATVAREEAARRIKEIEDQATQQVAQQRELAIAQEKARQKKYLENREKEIKENTVKALQPELENLIARQKRELDEIRAAKEEEIRAAKASIERLAEEERTRLIEQMDRERKLEVQQVEQRLQGQLDRERQIHNAELDRLVEKLKVTQSELDKNLSKPAQIVVEAARSENDAIIAEMRDRWRAELEAEQLKHQQEVAKLKNEFEKKVEIAVNEEKEKFAKKEEAIKAQTTEVSKEKNQKKLQVVIEKLEAETNQKVKKVTDDAERKISAAQAETKKFVLQLEDLQASSKRQISLLEAGIADERAMNGRLERENERLMHEIENHKTTIKSLHTELDAKDKLLQNTLNSYDSRIKDAKKELEAELSRQKEQNAKDRAAFEAEKMSWQAEKETIAKSNEEEFAAVTKRVRALVEQRDDTINQLREQLTLAQQRLKEAEQIFHQQKKTVLTAKNPARESTSSKASARDSVVRKSQVLKK